MLQLFFLKKKRGNDEWWKSAKKDKKAVFEYLSSGWTVLNQDVAIQRAVFRFSYVFIHCLPRQPWKTSFIVLFLFWILCYICINVSCLWISILHKKSSYIYIYFLNRFNSLSNCWNGWYRIPCYFLGRSQHRVKVNFTFLELDGKPRAEAVSSKLPMLPPGGLAKQFKASTKKTNMCEKVGWLEALGNLFFLSLRSQQVWRFDGWEVLIFFCVGDGHWDLQLFFLQMESTWFQSKSLSKTV